MEDQVVDLQWVIADLQPQLDQELVDKEMLEVLVLLAHTFMAEVEVLELWVEMQLIELQDLVV